MADKPAFIKKITARDVGCAKGPAQEFTVIGKVSRATPGDGQYGSFVKFGGMFEATHADPETGEIATYRSALLIVPAVVEDLVYSAFETARGADGSAIVGLAFRFFTKPDPSKIEGYVWSAEQLYEMFQSDPLEDMRKLLPAPKGAPKPARNAQVKTAE